MKIENDIYGLENYCQIRWTSRKNDRSLQKISKIVYILLERIINFGTPSSMRAQALAPFALCVGNKSLMIPKYNENNHFPLEIQML